MKTKCKERVMFAKVCIDAGKNGFCEYIIPYLHKEEYMILDEVCKAKTIEEYLESIVGKKLFKEDQKKLIDKIDIKINGRQIKSISNINTVISDIFNLNYKLKSKVVKIDNKRHTVWILESTKK